MFGDTVMAAVMSARLFTRDQYATNHPAGKIGKSLIFKVPLLILLLSSIFSLQLPSSALASLSSLSRGSSLSIEDETNILISPNKFFSCGFYKVGSNAYTFSIWFTNTADRTPAWTANRDRPVYARGSRVTMRKDGGVVLTDVDGAVVWSTNTSSTHASILQLLDTGNLVVRDRTGNILWQSFDSPTDTLLPLQPFTKTTKLVSAAAKGLQTGFYSLMFDNDNVLKLIYNGPEFSGIYWPDSSQPMWYYGRDTYNSSRFAMLDRAGGFVSSDNLTCNASDLGDRNVLRRLTLDYDGNLRLYSLDHEESTSKWSIAWEAVPMLCTIFGMCGKNGICSYTRQKEICSCPPNHDMVDPGDWTKGCAPQYNVNFCSQDPASLGFLKLPQVDFWGFDRKGTSPVSYKDCVRNCLVDCSCQAMVYRSGAKNLGNCYTKSALYNGRSFPLIEGGIYLKVPMHLASSNFSLSAVESLIRCNASSNEESFGITYHNSSQGGRTNWLIFYTFIGTVGITELLFILIGWCFIFKKDQVPVLEEEGYRMIFSHFRKFTYRELKKATKNFKEELGRGGSGAVFKGVLDDHDKRVVAVKRLENVMQGEEEFQAELSLIGRIYHKNLVKMLGFCSEGSHRLLISEYVEFGDLDKHLFPAGSSDDHAVLEWCDRFKIALGVARGLAYLHHECLEWVTHCDIKPENILLDSDLEPKIADFGLVKLSSRGGLGDEGDDVSRIRGTRGYMAPEWTSNVPITSKVDVYSYGVVLLELVTGARVLDWMKEDSDYQEGISGGNRKLMSTVGRTLKGRMRAAGINNVNDGDQMSWVVNFVDVRLNGELINLDQAEAMVKISARCLEEEGSARPTMEEVVEILLSFDHNI